ncbi:hypothetical protein [Aeromicrobium sp. UC242_57]|uniref:hypothetical protein n=1 Tax=Aeromicrobium sp. UC242_57 TaxID=3374624 RepID=UPI003792A067
MENRPGLTSVVVAVVIVAVIVIVVVRAVVIVVVAQAWRDLVVIGLDRRRGRGLRGGCRRRRRGRRRGRFEDDRRGVLRAPDRPPPTHGPR